MAPNLRAVLRLTTGYRRHYTLAVVMLVLASVFLYLPQLIIQVVIDGVLLSTSSTEAAWTQTLVAWLGGREFLRAHLWWPGLAVVGLTAVAGVFTYVRGRLVATATESVVLRLRNHVYDHLQRLPAAFFDKAETGDLIQRCTSDVETVRAFLSAQLVEIGRALTMLVVPIPLMLAIDRRMTMVALALVPAITVFSAVFFLRIKALFKLTDEAEAAMTAAIQENLTGIRVVRAFARQAFENTRFAVHNERYRDTDRRLYRAQSWFWSISDFLCFSQKALVIAVGAYWIATNTISVGAFVFFLISVSMFTYPMRMLGRIVVELGKALVSINRLRDILDQRIETDAEDAIELPPGEGELVLEHVSFAYADGHPVLDDVSVRVAPRETLAIIGASGAGKSTLVALLLRFYDPTRGSIRIDGVDVRELPRSTVRQRIAVVLQQPFLFSKTIAENLRLGRSDASLLELEEAATMAAVHGSIEGFADRYETRVGERGVTLSGGQRQRMALARAMLRQPLVMILDDALSAVDTRTEAAILASLRARRGRQTTIVIAHRLSTVSLADRILVLDHGRVVELGTHAELVARPGLYARLWQLQHTDDPEPEPAPKAMPEPALLTPPFTVPPATTLQPQEEGAA